MSKIGRLFRGITQSSYITIDGIPTGCTERVHLARLWHANTGGWPYSRTHRPGVLDLANGMVETLLVSYRDGQNACLYVEGTYIDVQEFSTIRVRIIPTGILTVLGL